MHKLQHKSPHSFSTWSIFSKYFWRQSLNSGVAHNVGGGTDGKVAPPSAKVMSHFSESASTPAPPNSMLAHTYLFCFFLAGPAHTCPTLKWGEGGLAKMRHYFCRCLSALKSEFGPILGGPAELDLLALTHSKLELPPGPEGKSSRSSHPQH